MKGYVFRYARTLADVFEQHGPLIGTCETCGQIEFPSSLDESHIHPLSPYVLIIDIPTAKAVV